MMKVWKWLDERLEETLLIVLLVLIACVELAQVIIRNIPWIPALTWAEEFCRFCWIWSVFLSLPYTIRKAGMLRVSMLPELLSEKAEKILNITVELINAGCMLFLGIHSVTVIGRILTGGETSPAMLWPMWIVYSIMLPGFFGGFLRGMQQVWRQTRSLGEKTRTGKARILAAGAEKAAADRGAERPEGENR